MKKTQLNDKGQVIVTLTDGSEFTLDRPKGKHLSAIAKAASENTDNIGVAAAAISILSGLSVEEVLDLDGEDFLEVAKALETFQVFRTMAKR